MGDCKNLNKDSVVGGGMCAYIGIAVGCNLFQRGHNISKRKNYEFEVSLYSATFIFTFGRRRSLPHVFTEFGLKVGVQLEKLLFRMKWRRGA